MCDGQAPLCQALAKEAARNAARFHMPGHKGRCPGSDDFWRWDVTELSGTGDLYRDTSGPIREAEQAMAHRLGADACLFLTGGSTQGVLSMLAAYAQPGDTVIVDRNVHRSVHNALALLRLTPVWVASPTLRPFGITGPVDIQAFAQTVAAHPHAACILVTSPTYYGVHSDIGALAKACAPKPLLVDAAHGALHLFAGHSGAVRQGAAAAVYSAHKTWPALGQSAFLLLRENEDAEHVRSFCAVFGSSSPSYPLMASMDAARVWLSAQPPHKVLEEAAHLRERFPFILDRPDLDPARLCIYTGRGVQDALWLEETFGIVCEMADRHNIVCIMSAVDTRRDWDRLEKGLAALSERLPSMPEVSEGEPWPVFTQACPAHEALWGKQEKQPLGRCLGRIAGALAEPYPPGVALVARGERIDQKAIGFLQAMGYTEEEPLWVLREHTGC